MIRSGSFLICFEGIAGSGKTTQSLLLKKRLESAGFAGSVIVSKAYEAEEKEAADQLIKSLQINPSSTAMMFLFQALHALQYEQTKNALEEGKIVIADRWGDSFWAYHSNFGFLSREPHEVLAVLDRLAFQELKPDLTFILDVSPEVAIKRFSARGPDNKLFPQENLPAFLGILRTHYLKDLTRPSRQLIDASLSVESVEQLIWKKVNRLLVGSS